jgi:hypothetical protein
LEFGDMMITFEQIKESVKDIEHTEIFHQRFQSNGVKFKKYGMNVEIFPQYIAVKGECEDILSWEFMDNPTLENVQFTVIDPRWFC